MRILSRSAFACVAFVGTVLIADMVYAEPLQGSGIEGVISVSPSKPGPLRKGEQSAAPAGNIEFIVKKDDIRITSFSTDAEGKFRVSLPPGHYTVSREDSGSGPGQWHFEIDVAGGEYKKVSWTGDSGMR